MKYFARLWSSGIGFFVMLVVFFLILPAQAHEAYVLSPDTFRLGLAAPRFDLFASLSDPNNLRLALLAGLGIGIVLVGNMYLRLTPLGLRIRAFFERGQNVSAVALRLALAVSLFASAFTYSFLAPELSLTALPFVQVLRWALFAISFCLAIGFLTELAALLALLIYLIAAMVFGWYLFTYVNYVGEMAALFLYGSRIFSVDSRLWGTRKKWRLDKKYELLILRVCYGAALFFAAINIKFFHPTLSALVVDQYNLTQFHWLFPSDPLFLVLGAALVEMTIGLCILLGFQVRLINVVVLFYMTLSLLFFRESVWPHLMLYGLSLLLIFSPDVFGVDYLIDKARSKRRGLGYRYS